MNERIAALLARLGADPALRARFKEDAGAVMAEAGLTPLERAELGRHVDAEGMPHRESITPSDAPVDAPLDAPEGRIFSTDAEGRIFSTDAEGRIFAAGDEPASDEPAADQPS
ncbi:MAG TPA: hypothetical protein VNK95_02065 [Caldilineaceae bacterium]|nr:hypothetical protein [Caldilineaceae bacterium]